MATRVSTLPSLSQARTRARPETSACGSSRPQSSVDPCRRSSAPGSESARGALRLDPPPGAGCGSLAVGPFGCRLGASAPADREVRSDTWLGRAHARGCRVPTAREAAETPEIPHANPLVGFTKRRRQDPPRPASDLTTWERGTELARWRHDPAWRKDAARCRRSRRRCRPTARAGRGGRLAAIDGKRAGGGGVGPAACRHPQRRESAPPAQGVY